MMFKDNFYLLLWCFLIPYFSLTSAVANELTYKKLGQLHEAANNGFVEDDDGFIWIGTQNGLIKWMGEELIKYTPENSSLIGANISAITQGDNGVLWVATLDGGLNKYDKLTNKFVHIEGGDLITVSSIGGWRKTQPLALVSNDELVFISEQRLIHFKAGIFRQISLTNDKQALTGAVFCQTKVCYIGIEGGLVVLDLVTEKTYLATKHNGLLQFSSQKKLFSTLIPYQNKSISNFTYDTIKQELWLIHSPSIGLSQFTLSSGQVESYFNGDF